MPTETRRNRKINTSSSFHVLVLVLTDPDLDSAIQYVLDSNPFNLILLILFFSLIKRLEEKNREKKSVNDTTFYIIIPKITLNKSNSIL